MSVIIQQREKIILNFIRENITQMRCLNVISVILKLTGTVILQTILQWNMQEIIEQISFLIGQVI
mgnify:CR=1 FL=1